MIFLFPTFDYLFIYGIKGIDVGAADLIINGAINIKSGAEIKAFDENGKTVLFTDGSEIDVDAIIFAYVSLLSDVCMSLISENGRSFSIYRTGYENIRSSIRKLFGSELIDSTSEAWGLDAEGELRGCYRPSGHPGVILFPLLPCRRLNLTNSQTFFCLISFGMRPETFITPDTCQNNSCVYSGPLFF